MGFFGGGFFRWVYPKKPKWFFWVRTRVSEPCLRPLHGWSPPWITCCHSASGRLSVAIRRCAKPICWHTWTHTTTRYWINDRPMPRDRLNWLRSIRNSPSRNAWWDEAKITRGFNLGSGSWLAWANDTAAHYAAIHCPRQRTTGTISVLLVL